MELPSQIPALLHKMRTNRAAHSQRILQARTRREATAFRNALTQMTRADAAPSEAVRNLLEDFIVQRGLCLEALEYAHGVLEREKAESADHADLRRHDALGLNDGKPQKNCGAWDDDDGCH